VARMNRLRAGDLGGGDDGRDIEIRLRSGGRAHAHALVGEADVHGVAISFRVDGHRVDAHLLASTVHAEGDLSAVRYDDLVEHRWRYSMMTRGSPNSTGCWFSIRICVTLPPRGAVTGLNVFIASTSSSVAPAFTVSPTLTNFGAPSSACR